MQAAARATTVYEKEQLARRQKHEEEEARIRAKKAAAKAHNVTEVLPRTLGCCWCVMARAGVFPSFPCSRQRSRRRKALHQPKVIPSKAYVASVGARISLGLCMLTMVLSSVM